MFNDPVVQIVVPMAALLLLVIGWFVLTEGRRTRVERRIARVTNRGPVLQKKKDAMSLRKMQANSIPFIINLFRNIASMGMLQARLQRAGLAVSAETYATACLGGAVLVGGIVFLIKHSPWLGVLAGLFLGLIIPHFVVGHLGSSRSKKFLVLFPDAIDFIVRGLRSGLPVVESFNVIGAEMEEPLKSTFSTIGEQVKLGMPVEKALQEVGARLGLTEFNFFVTSIILQRATGGNLSEILNNLSDVLRKRVMMRMKIKAMAAEGKASAMIVGALPFVVLSALEVLSPEYLDPLFNDVRGNIAGAGAAFSLCLGVGIMIKMASFEI